MTDWVAHATLEEILPMFLEGQRIVKINQRIRQRKITCEQEHPDRPDCGWLHRHPVGRLQVVLTVESNDP